MGVRCSGKMLNKEVEQQHIEAQQHLNEMLSENGMMEEDFKIVAIGYLDSSEPFEKGEVSTSFLSKLKLLWNEGGSIMSLGFHECTLCEGGYGTGERATSSSEKTLTDRENKIRYVFPEMIFHYITVHKFKPSNEFIEFVMRS